MALNKYDVLIKIADTGSLTKTAEELNYTQSAISHVIKNMEDEYGFRLIIRRKNGVDLTSEGEMLLEEARQVCRAEQNFDRKVMMLSGLISGRLRVGCFSSVSIQWMPDIIKNIEGAHPNIEIFQRHMTYRDIEDGLENGTLECGFMTDKMNQKLEFVPLAMDEYMVVLPPDHPLCRYERIPVEALNDEDFILLDEGAGVYDTGRIISACHPRIKHMAEEDLVIVPMVSKGLGISILPQLLLDCADTSGIVIKRFAIPRIRTIGLAIKSPDRSTPLTRLFLKYTKDFLREKDLLVKNERQE